MEERYELSVDLATIPINYIRPTVHLSERRGETIWDYMGLVARAIRREIVNQLSWTIRKPTKFVERNLKWHPLVIRMSRDVYRSNKRWDDVMNIFQQYVEIE